MLSLTFGKLVSSYTRSISALSSKSTDKFVFYEGLGFFFWCVCTFTVQHFFELYTLSAFKTLSYPQADGGQLQRIKPPLHRMSLTGNFKRKKQDNAVPIQKFLFFLCSFLYSLTHSLKALSQVS